MLRACMRPCARASVRTSACVYACPSGNCPSRNCPLIRSRAENSDEPTSSVIQNATISSPLAAAGSLPSRDAMGRLVRRKRKAAEMI